MILLIDNYDSFSYNLYQQIEKLGGKTVVKENDKITIKEIKELNPSKIVISPGPQTPNESGISNKVIETFYREKPILGVCLGHECIGQIFGSKITQAKTILHGKTSEITTTQKHIFEGLPKKLSVARYHSLIINKLPKEFELLAWDEKKEIMAIKHKNHDLYGVQFHPESFMTKHGDKIISNFLKI